MYLLNSAMATATRMQDGNPGTIMSIFTSRSFLFFFFPKQQHSLFHHFLIDLCCHSAYSKYSSLWQRWITNFEYASMNGVIVTWSRFELQNLMVSNFWCKKNIIQRPQFKPTIWSFSSKIISSNWKLAVMVSTKTVALKFHLALLNTLEQIQTLCSTTLLNNALILVVEIQCSSILQHCLCVMEYIQTKIN
jgi:hypothetical protein